MIHYVQTRHQYLALGLLFLLAVGVSAVWINKGREHHFPDAPNGQFGCLSYTPRTAGSNVSEARTRAQIAIDLQQLSLRTHCVRTYSVLNGLDEVPVVARKLGMKVLLGLWIGRSDEANDMEIRHGIEVANANRDVIEAIIVGNEVLLRREQDAPALAAMMQRVHNATQLPVTYADVWDFWLKNPSLAESASFITIHILPYWDDIPISIDHAMDHVDDIYKKIQAAFPGRKIFVGETGWPSAGRQREGALPSLVNEARFTREFIAYANAHSLPNNFIEAYDQPWKRVQEGTVGGYWGLYNAAGQAKFSLTGPVVEDVHWWRGLVSGAVFALIFTMIALVRQRSITSLAVVALAGFSLGAMLLLQWHYWMISNRSWQEWLVATVWGCSNDLVFLFALINATSQKSWAQRALLISSAVMMFGLAYINLGLVFDARYRDFPSLFVILPAVSLLIIRIGNSNTNPLSHLIHPVYGLLFSFWMLVSVIAIAGIEGLRNTSAIGWCICCLLLAWSMLPRLQPVQVLQTQTNI